MEKLEVGIFQKKNEEDTENVVQDPKSDTIYKNFSNLYSKPLTVQDPKSDTI